LSEDQDPGLSSHRYHNKDTLIRVRRQ